MSCSIMNVMFVKESGYMSNIEGMLKQVLENDELKGKLLKAASSKESLEAFLKEKGINVDVDEAMKFVKDNIAKSGVSVDSIAKMAGGFFSK